MLNELFLTRQKTNTRKAFANNMSTDIKLSKAQICKIIQSDGSFGSWLCNLDRKSTNKCCYSFCYNLPGLIHNRTSNAMNKFKEK